MPASRQRNEVLDADLAKKTRLRRSRGKIQELTTVPGAGQLLNFGAALGFPIHRDDVS
jgi:hypothetical protein